VSNLLEPINRYYYGYAFKTGAAQALLETQDNELALIEVVREAFTAGARWQLRESAKLSPHIAKFLEMVILLGPDSPRDDWLTDTDSTEGTVKNDYPDPIEHAPF